jgi:hypothetical protein
LDGTARTTTWGGKAKDGKAKDVTGVRVCLAYGLDPGLVMTCCANCGKQMIDRKCKMICECGYFLSCSDYY